MNWLSRPRFESSDSALLFEFFATRLEHLIMARFFDPVGDEMLPERFFVFVYPWSRHAMSGVARRHFPFIL